MKIKIRLTVKCDYLTNNYKYFSLFLPNYYFENDLKVVPDYGYSTI